MHCAKLTLIKEILEIKAAYFVKFLDNRYVHIYR